MCVFLCAFRWNTHTYTSRVTVAYCYIRICACRLSIRIFQGENIHTQTHTAQGESSRITVCTYCKHIAHQRNVNMLYLWLGIHGGQGGGERGGFYFVHSKPNSVTVSALQERMLEASCLFALEFCFHVPSWKMASFFILCVVNINGNGNHYT